MVAASELPIDTGASATEMAQEIFGDGVTVVNASYTGDALSSGIYTDGNATSPGVTPSDSGVILSTGQAQDFTNSNGEANQNTNTSTNTSGPNDNSLFNNAAGTRTFDAAWLDVDFIPTGDTMTMQFVFSSEEYPEYVDSVFQDFVGIWVNGQQVELAIGDGDTDPGNINGADNQNLYVDNTNDEYNTEMDGFTVTMTLSFPVISGEVNSIRIGIADVGDSQYDSNLLIAGNSAQTAVIANADTLDMGVGGTKTVDLLANDENSTGGTLTITHINGQVVTAGGTVTLATGQQITVNGDGTIEVVADADAEIANFTYTVESSTGTSDIGFVTVNQIPCFVAGTLIRTPRGEVPVESLRPGDMVQTQDDGAKPIRWSGQRTVEARGDFAPICIRQGTFGATRDVMLSPQHRVLVRDSLADLLFGSAEVLVAAKNLVNGDTVQIVEAAEVTYVHLLFDRHQVVFSEGIASESFLPGPQTSNLFEAEVQAEICAIFPELDPATGAGYGPAARRTLRSYEAQLLMSAQDAAA